MTKKTKVKKTPKVFKTSWGAEYTLVVNENTDEGTSEPTIDDLVEKSRKEKLVNKKK